MAERGLSGYQCGICLLSISNPKLLSCHHSFCLKCLEEEFRVTHRLCCPTCRAITNIPANGVKGLQHNFYISSEKSTGSEKGEGLDCDICQKGTTNIQKCVHCDQYLCEVCAHAHLMMKASQTHKLITISAKQRKQIGKVKRRSFCKNHPNKEIEVICKVCNELMCCVCKITRHETHLCRDIATEADEKRAETNELIKSYENKLIEQGNINASMKARTEIKKRFLSDTMISMRREKETVIRNIQESFDEFEGKMDGLFGEFIDTSNAIVEDQARVLSLNKETVKRCKRIMNLEDDVTQLQMFEQSANVLSAVDTVQPPDVSDDEINKNFHICDNWLKDVKVQSRNTTDFYGHIRNSTHTSDSTDKSATTANGGKTCGTKGKWPFTHSTGMVGGNRWKTRNKYQTSSQALCDSYQQNQNTYYNKF